MPVLETKTFGQPFDNRQGVRLLNKYLRTRFTRFQPRVINASLRSALSKKLRFIINTFIKNTTIHLMIVKLVDRVLRKLTN